MSDKDFMPIYQRVREVNSQHGYRQITRIDNGVAAKNNHEQVEKHILSFNILVTVVNTCNISSVKLSEKTMYNTKLIAELSVGSCSFHYICNLSGKIANNTGISIRITENHVFFCSKCLF